MPLLETFLLWHLATDDNALVSLPYIYQVLSPKDFTPSSHLGKWNARLNTLLHSQDPGARWVGLCLAYKTCRCSKAIMKDSAHSWVSVALPLLSRNEPPPTLKAAIRLLGYVFQRTTDFPEFQRQTVIPNLPKYSLALIGIVQKSSSLDLKTTACSALKRIVVTFPSQHRALLSQINATSDLCLSQEASPDLLVDKSIDLVSSLHLVAGKVGAGAAWRSRVDRVLQEASDCLLSIRSTYSDPNSQNLSRTNGTAHDPRAASGPSMTGTATHFKKLHRSVDILLSLLKAYSPRQLELPLAELVNLGLRMMRCKIDENNQGVVDDNLRAMENAVTPDIWALGCQLLVSLSNCVHQRLVPYVVAINHIILQRLEEKRPQTRSHALPFLKLFVEVASCTPVHHDDVHSNRIAQLIIPNLTNLLSKKVEAEPSGDPKRSKGQKRSRGNEGDEQFKLIKRVVCDSKDDGDLVKSSLDALHLLVHRTSLQPSVRSLIVKLMLSLRLSLPQMPPSSISAVSLALHAELSIKIRQICLDILTDPFGLGEQAFGLIFAAESRASESGLILDSSSILHPRLPPLVKSHLSHSSVILFSSEESPEDISLRQSSGIAQANSLPDPSKQAAPSSVALQASAGHLADQIAAPVVPPSFPTSTSQYTDRLSQSVGVDDTIMTDVPVFKEAPGVAQEINLPSQESQELQPTSQIPTDTNVTAVPPRSKPTVQPAPYSRPSAAALVPSDDDDDDEPLPEINMDSSSEEE
ncbi:hypothetical protein SISNIDRAFT_481768 [Sistotremastrum niveocremeum HHB9708]|uniref:Pre-rRNA-processing protein RIX1 n=1 Tax=Sistotremastrum niveocremeum HHB9708 TaxID=1314777 RepID=A0A164ZNH7_9AGAM|nr:hypothetical protein SISNIDRAFT_481768 [Sistotremastrum niveocremeum HHB9708]